MEEHPKSIKYKNENKKPKKKRLLSLIEYCERKNISFSENEQRYYEFAKSKQNHKFWVDYWKKFCNLNLIKRVSPTQSEFPTPYKVTMLNNSSTVW